MTPNATSRVMPRRVLFLEHNTDGTVGGSHFCLLDICRELDRDRYFPVVRFFQDNTLSSEFKATGAEIHIAPPLSPFRFAARSDSRVFGMMLRPLQAAANLTVGFARGVLYWRSVLRALAIDIVHLNNSAGDDHDLLIAARSLRLPCIAHQRGFPRPFRGVDKLLVRFASRVIAISAAVRSDLQFKGVAAGSITLIHDGIAPARVAPTLSREECLRHLDCDDNARIIGVVGNVKAWKGQLTLIRAMSEVVSTHPNTVCLIIGSIADTQYKRTLDAEVNERGLQRHIKFMGYQRRPIDYTAHMEVVVHTSIEPEPFGIVILEAMALAKPIVATAIGGPLDIVVDGSSGYLTPPGDSKALAQRVIELLADSSRARHIGANGRLRFEQAFTAARTVRAIEGVYASTLTGRHDTK